MESVHREKREECDRQRESLRAEREQRENKSEKSERVVVFVFSSHPPFTSWMVGVAEG